MRLTQRYTGRSHYQSDAVQDGHRLFVAIPCYLEGEFVDALLDTASEWCVLPGWMASEMGIDLRPETFDTRLHSRLGSLTGRLDRMRTGFHPDEGQLVELEATWFLTEDWIGPPVIGWKGCLERVRIGLDPSEEWFYFAEL